MISIVLPPLRDRGDDVLLLLRRIVAKFAKELGKPEPRFTDAALHALKNGYHWPGNVRELENLVQSLVVMVDGHTIDVSDLPGLMRFTASCGNNVARTLAEVEAEHLRNVLASVAGNKTKAARILPRARSHLRPAVRGDHHRGRENLSRRPLPFQHHGRRDRCGGNPGR